MRDRPDPGARLGQAAASFRFRKGGVALIDTKSGKLADGTLLWFIPPKVFRALG
jgi:hypothetical protein